MVLVRRIHLLFAGHCKNSIFCLILALYYTYYIMKTENKAESQTIKETKVATENKIGKVVTLKSNHLKSTEHFGSVLLAGEPNYITPLMIIKEVLITNPEKVDEETGEFKNAKGNLQFKCIWFSNKSFKLEEAWFYENELTFVELNSNKQTTFKYGDNVVLKTNQLELKKRKTFLEINKEKSNQKVSALLNFCSPVFIFIGYTTVEKKEALIDQVLEKHKITEARWDTSLSWYSDKIDLYLQINDSVKSRLKRVQEDLDREVLRIAKLIKFDEPAKTRGKPVGYKGAWKVEEGKEFDMMKSN